MYNTLKIITRMKNKPKFVIWENVSGLLSKKHEHNFYTYLKIMRDLGYKNYSKVLFAKDYGIPQSRPRSFVVSIYECEDFKFPKKKLLKHSFREYLVDEYNENVVLNENHKKRIKGIKGCDVSYNFGGKVVTGDIFPTITKCYRKANGNGGTIQCKNGDYRTLEPIERWRLQGFDDEDFLKAEKVNSSTQLNSQAGNSIAVPVLVSLLKSLFGKDDNRYRLYRYHPLIDYIEQALLTKKDKPTFDDKGNPYSAIWTQYGTIIVKINNFKRLKKYLPKTRSEKGIVEPSTVRILKMCLMEITEKNYKTNSRKQFTAKSAKIVDIKTKTFMKLQGLNRKQLYFVNSEIGKAIAFLTNISVEFKNKKIINKEGKELPLVINSICKTTTKLEKYTNNLHFVLNDELNNLLFEEGTDMAIPTELFQIDAGDHPHSWFLGNKIFQEIGTANEIKIKVKDLLSVCPTLPKYATELGYNEIAQKRKIYEDELNDNQLIIKKNRNPYQHIIKPVERDLNVICEYRWKYESTGTNQWKQPGANDRTRFSKFYNENIIITRRKRLGFRASKVKSSKFTRCKKYEVISNCVS